MNLTNFKRLSYETFYCNFIHCLISTMYKYAISGEGGLHHVLFTRVHTTQCQGIY